MLVPSLFSSEPSNIKTAIGLINSDTTDDQKLGLHIIENSAFKNNPQALLILADLYFEGRLKDRNSTMAFILTKKASELNLPEAQNNLGFFYLKGIGTQKNPILSTQLFTKAANNQFPPSQYNLGMAHEKGLGTKKDIIEAVDLYRKSGNSGYIKAQIRLGKLYANKQPKESFRWMRMAADNGHATAQYETAKAYLSGNGTPQNPTLAFDYLELAAKQDQPGSNFLLGELFYDGYGTSRNQEKGISLIKKAGNLGNQTAIKLLPKLSVKKFDFLASLQKASDGDTNSIINLGWNYFEGVNIGKNNIEAYAWFNLAAEFTGDKKHIWARSFIAKQLDINELIDAKKRASQISNLYKIKKPIRK